MVSVFANWRFSTCSKAFLLGKHNEDTVTDDKDTENGNIDSTGRNDIEVNDYNEYNEYNQYTEYNENDQYAEYGR